MSQSINVEEIVQTWIKEEAKPLISSFFTPLLGAVGAPILQTLAGENPALCGTGAAAARQAGAQISRDLHDGATQAAIDALYASIPNTVSTVLGLAQSSSGWNPVNPDDPQAAQKFVAYSERISSFPLLVLQSASTNNLHYQESNYNSLIDKISALYTDVSSRDIGAIKTSLSNIIKACTSRVNTKNTQTLFTQSTIVADGGTISLVLCSSTIMMEYNHQSGKGAPKDTYRTDIAARQVIYQFNASAYSKAIARSLLNKTFTSVDEWINGATTPPGPAKVQFCFD